MNGVAYLGMIFSKQSMMGAGCSHGSDCKASWGLVVPTHGCLPAVSFYAARKSWGWGISINHSRTCSK